MIPIDVWCMNTMYKYLNFMKFNDSERREMEIVIMQKIKKLPCDELVKYFTNLEVFMIQSQHLCNQKKDLC